jgi:fructose-1,6-bisphosphatase/sedoheptulose 1,7-bisphosphatase-like protein
MIPRDPTVRELSLFQTGAPELVLHCGPLKELDGRYCSRSHQNQEPAGDESSNRQPEQQREHAYLVGVHGA